MQDVPTPDDLLAAVADFLRAQAVPRLSGQASFHARVAANALDIVRRQLALGPAAEADELRRLRDLLRSDGSLVELNGQLCARIASGEFDPHSPALLHHLWRTTLDKLAVDQPGYESYRRLRGAID